MKATIHDLADLRKVATEEDIKKIVTEYMMETIAKAELYDNLPSSIKDAEK